MAIRGVLETRSSPSNAYIFSPHIIDPNSIEQQFSRLKAWMYESSEATRLELLQLLFPVFNHFYLEMVAAGHKMPASKFFKKYQVLSSFKFIVQDFTSTKFWFFDHSKDFISFVK